MFIIVYFLLLAIITSINNKIKQINGNNEDSYKMNFKHSLVLICLFLIGVLLTIFSSSLKDIFVFLLIAYSITCIITFILVNFLRIQAIENKREQYKQIFEILEPVLKSKTNTDDEVDFNNIPFEIIYDNNGKDIANIKVSIKNADKFTDSAITQCVYNLNKFLPYKRWVNSVDFPERLCEFIGENLPPAVANFPGSDLRPWNWIPLGLSGKGEIGWNLGAKKDQLGRSLYVYEETGLEAQTVLTPKSPQALAVGSTGGGKAIPIDEYVYVE